MKQFNLLTVFLLLISNTFSQNVGIGTPSPGQKLDVIGNVRAGSPVSNAIMGTHPSYGNGYAAWWKDGVDYSLLCDGTNTYLNAPSASGSILFRAGNSEKFYIRGTDGFAGLGTSSPATHFEVSGTFQKLRITSTNSNNCALEFANTGNLSWRMYASGYIGFDYGNDLSAALNTTIDINPVTHVLEPYADNSYGLGNSTYRWNSIYATTGVVQTSDARLKKNIENINYGLGTLMKMRPVSFQWKDGSNGNRTSLGFLAQDIIKLMPEVVYHDTPVEDPNKKNAKANIDAYGMNYSELIPVLVKSIQEQQQMIQQLKKEIEELKRK